MQLTLTFSKTGNIRFISHLDLTRTFLRALKRAEIPLDSRGAYTKHPKLSFALPLPVGQESLCETAFLTLAEDVSLAPEEVKARLAPQMPKGIAILSCEELAAKKPEIAFCEYAIVVPDFPEELLEDAKRAFSGDVLIKKRAKKGGEKEVNLKNGIRSLTFTMYNGALIIEAALSASGENYLNPELLFRALQNALEGKAALPEKRILREAVLLR